MRVRFGKLTAVLLGTTAVGLGAAEIAANLEAQSQVRNLVKAHEGLAIGGVFTEVIGGRVTLHDIKSSHGAIGVSIGSLTLPAAQGGLGLIGSAKASPFDDDPEEKEGEPGPVEKALPATPKTPEAAAPKPEAEAPKPAAQKKDGAVTGTASAENVTITTPNTVYKIKRIDLTGTSLSDADLAAILDAKSAETIEARVKKLNATSIVMPEVIAEDPTGPAERHATMQQVTLSGVVNGRATASSVASTSVAVKNADKNLTGTIGPIQAVGLNLPQIAHVAGTRRTDDAEPIQSLYDSVTATAITFTDEKGAGFTVGSVKESNLKGRPFKTDLQKAGKEKLTDVEQAALFDDLTHSFEVGLIEFKDMIIQGDKTKDGPQSFRISNFSMRDFAKGKVGGMSMNGFGVEGPDIKLALGNLEVGAFNLPKPKVAGVPQEPPTAMLPAVVKVDFSDFDLDVAPKKDSKTPNHFLMKIAHAGFASEGDAGDIPRSSKVTVDNIAFDLPPGNTQAQPFVDMGYSHVDLSAAMSTAYDSAKQELHLQDLSLKGVKMGSVAIGLQLLNVTKGVLSPNKEVAKASWIAVLAKALSLNVVNDGLVDRLLAWKAKQDGISAEAEKASIVDFMRKQLPSQFNSANVKLIGEAVAKFIENPKNLHIDITSKNGLGAGAMSMLNDPAMLIDTLDVKASANQ